MTSEEKHLPETDAGISPREDILRDEIPEDDEIIEDEVLEEDEIVTEDEVLEEDESVIDDEVPEEDESVTDDEVLEEDESVIEDEIPEEDESVTDDEVLEEDESVIEDEIPEEDESVIDDEVLEEGEIVCEDEEAEEEVSEESYLDDEDFATLYEDDEPEAETEEKEDLTPEYEALKEALDEVASMPSPAPKAPEASVIRRITEEEYAAFMAEEALSDAEKAPEETAEAPEIIPEKAAKETPAPEKSKKAKKEKKAGRKAEPSEEDAVYEIRPERKDGCLRDVFLLYCSSDLTLAYKTTLLLEANGVSCIFPDRDLPRNDENHNLTIEKAIRASRAVLVITGKNASNRLRLLENLKTAVAMEKRIIQFKRDEAPLTQSLTNLLSEVPTVRAKSFKPERLVLTVKTALERSGKQKKSSASSDAAKKGKKKVLNLNKIHSSFLNALGKRVLAVCVIAYLLLTAVSFMMEDIDRFRFLLEQFPSSAYIAAKIALFRDKVSTFLGFSVGITALTAAVLSVLSVLLSTPFTRYGARRAGRVFLFLNSCVLCLSVAAAFLDSPDLIRAVLSNLTLIASYAVIIPVYIIAAKLTKIRR